MKEDYFQNRILIPVLGVNRYMVTLETDRTILRPLNKQDLQAVQLWSSVPENVTHMPWGPNTDAETLEFLDTCEKNWAADPTKKYDFGIVLKETGVLIGACKCYSIDDLCTGELGWIIRRDFWKRGLATEVAGALIRFSFETLRLHRVIALCNSENTGSWRVMEHNRMRREAHYLKCRRLRNVEPAFWVDMYEYAILDEEYFAEKTEIKGCTYA